MDPDRASREEAAIAPPTTLRREIGLPGAVLVGLGSMVGTGAFVSLGLAAGAAGSLLFTSVLLAGLLAAANGLSSAQLAAAYPVSGGSYEYGYRLISPVVGFSAGALFLVAKGASAATAALGGAGYVLGSFGVSGSAPRVALAVLLSLGITMLVASGLRRSTWGNLAVVSVTLIGLVALVAATVHGTFGSGAAVPAPPTGTSPPSRPGVEGLLAGAALAFVAFTGYGRIATLGEEVRDPGRVIPRAVVFTLSAVLALYLAVAWSATAVLGPPGFARAAAETAAPLEAVARALGRPRLVWLVSASAVTAMLGVLLNLVLGLSRVLFAMSRRGDAPGAFGRVDPGTGGPRSAVWACGSAVAVLCLLGDVKVTWTLSAFTVLVYYAITNLAALRLPENRRRYPRWIPAAGLGGCLGLAPWVDVQTLLAGSGAIGLAIVGRLLLRKE